MARLDGKTILHTQDIDGTGETSFGAKDTVLADGNCTDLWPDDNGCGSAADILPPKIGNIFMGPRMLYPGRSVPAADNGKRNPAESPRAQD